MQKSLLTQFLGKEFCRSTWIDILASLSIILCRFYPPIVVGANGIRPEAYGCIEIGLDGSMPLPPSFEQG